MNFYDLSQKLKIDVKKLFFIYNKVFPNVKIYDYTVKLNIKEIDMLKFLLTDETLEL